MCAPKSTIEPAKETFECFILISNYYSYKVLSPKLNICKLHKVHFIYHVFSSFPTLCLFFFFSVSFLLFWGNRNSSLFIFFSSLDISWNIPGCKESVRVIFCVSYVIFDLMQNIVIMSSCHFFYTIIIQVTFLIFDFYINYCPSKVLSA